jgi:hypothetical protein
MIISASRRSDIPAFHAEWFMDGVRAGHCEVPNPYNSQQFTGVSLKPEDVDVIVFWTRSPAPLMQYLAELDDRGYCYCFQYTLMDNPRELDLHTPDVKSAVDAFRQLSEVVGPEKVIWRYDPIVLSNMTTAEFHRCRFGRIAESLRGGTFRCVISIVDLYRKVRTRMKELEERGWQMSEGDGCEMRQLMRDIADIARANNMDIMSCAEEIELESCGIKPGKCVDNEYLRKVFGLDVTDRKDPSQRKACGCVVSRDIGSYNTCGFGCRYCYAGGVESKV